MKTKLISRSILAVTIPAVLALLAGNALAIENKSRVVSPYWQSDTTSYTFIAVTHPSLSGMASQIGLVLNAIQNDKSAFGTATTFTISAGNTTRVFIVRTNHSSINPTSISSAKFISGTTNFKHGHVRIDPKASNPEVRTSQNDGDGWRDVTMLSFWGAVVVEANTTGFAMEFIGDAHDSTA
nr:hypothetical protein [Nitrospinaceae bacterium]NIR53281.1 hypothetical protein [Nitrospinaceae bacterium]NIS83682.1 hypothetical protein [Nitrospinaceae bacterium]NIT80481.1 hypothetical protein [Nitrospinaceae bacterium]NIU42809.1 hypothetical protein [Nitrospinaceae bacterium]